jgi:hypothetical protein
MTNLLGRSKPDQKRSVTTDVLALAGRVVG